MGKSMVSCKISPKPIHWQNQSSHILHDPAAKLVMPRLRRETSRPCRGCHNALQGLTGHTATLHLHCTKLWGNASQKELRHTVPPQEKDGKGLIMFHDSCRNSLFLSCWGTLWGCYIYIYIYIYIWMDWTYFHLEGNGGNMCVCVCVKLCTKEFFTFCGWLQLTCFWPLSSINYWYRCAFNS